MVGIGWKLRWELGIGNWELGMGDEGGGSGRNVVCLPKHQAGASRTLPLHPRFLFDIQLACTRRKHIYIRPCLLSSLLLLFSRPDRKREFEKEGFC